MLATKTRELIEQLRAGTLDVASASALDELRADDLVNELKLDYPIVFLERAISHKTEFGFARTVGWELKRKVSNESPFPSIALTLILRRCVFLNAYDNRISGITTVSSIRLSKSSKDRVVLRASSCRKLDRTIDGWSVKVVRDRPAKFTTGMLQRRGWQFNNVVAEAPLR